MNTLSTQKTTNLRRTKFVTSVGVLSGIAVVLMQILEFPIPFMPPFLKFDFSNVPALIGGFAYGPLTGLLIVLIKALLHLTMTSSGGVGELADFFASGSFVLVASLVYKHLHTKKSAVIGMSAGALAMAAVGAVTNYFILIPFYEKIMPLEQIIEVCSKINPYINGMTTYVLFGAVPFNFIKAALISAVTFLIYKKISRIIK